MKPPTSQTGTIIYTCGCVLLAVAIVLVLDTAQQYSHLAVQRRAETHRLRERANATTKEVVALVAKLETAKKKVPAPRPPPPPPPYLADPEYRLFSGYLTRRSIYADYASYLAKFARDPDRQKRIRDLLIERQMALSDAAWRSGLSPDVADQQSLKRFEAEACKDIERALRETLGDEEYAELTRYRETEAERNIIATLGRRLDSVGRSLTDSQFVTLVNLLAEDQKTGNNEMDLPDGFISRASSILRADQLEYLRALQEQKLAESALVAFAAKQRPAKK